MTLNFPLSKLKELNPILLYTETNLDKLIKIRSINIEQITFNTVIRTNIDSCISILLVHTQHNTLNILHKRMLSLVLTWIIHECSRRSRKKIQRFTDRLSHKERERKANPKMKRNKANEVRKREKKLCCVNNNRNREKKNSRIKAWPLFL